MRLPAIGELRPVGMDDRLHRLGGAAAQRMHAHDVAAAHMLEQRADRDGLRRDRDVDLAPLP